MGFVFDLLQGAAKAIPLLVTKIVTVILGIFTIGLFIGYALAINGFTPQYLLIPVISMIVIWYKLDEGVLVLVLLLLMVLFYPDTIWP